MKPPEHHFINEYGQREIKRMWLGSGIADRNGIGIFEGDILEIDMTPNQPLPIFYHAAVTFEQGSFKVKGKPLNEFSPAQLEVVGHIAEETT